MNLIVPWELEVVPVPSAVPLEQAARLEKLARLGMVVQLEHDSYEW